ncbi:MAG: prolipoprotein diacylglyceryl transferase family protein [Myxococcota bacterium]
MKPVLFTLPGLGWEIQAYGFFVAVALVVAWASTLRLARADGFDPQRLGPVFVAAAAAGLIGARAAWVLQHPAAFDGVRSLMTLRAGTLAPFAGTLVALVVSGAWVSRMKVPVWAWYDLLAPAMALGVAFERFGALLAGTGFGRYAPDAALSIRFPAGSQAFDAHRHALANLMRSGATESLPVHPVQLYAAVLGLAGLGLCVALRGRRRFSGQVFLAFSMYYVAVRSFVEEFLRADAPAAVAGPLNGGQISAAAMLLVLWVVYAVRSRRAAAGDDGVAVPKPGPASTSPGPRKPRKKKKGSR